MKKRTQASRNRIGFVFEKLRRFANFDFALRVGNVNRLRNTQEFHYL
jgi:hypothetical protein